MKTVVYKYKAQVKGIDPFATAIRKEGLSPALAIQRGSSTYAVGYVVREELIALQGMITEILNDWVEEDAKATAATPV